MKNERGVCKFDKQVRTLIGEHDRGLADRIGDILIEIHAAAMVEAAEWPEGRHRDAWVHFAKRMQEYAHLSIDLPTEQVAFKGAD